MNRQSNSVDYAVMYEVESQVDSSFRRLRLSHEKLRHAISGSHEGYLRKILDVRQRQEALEQNKEYNKRRRQRRVLAHPLSEDSEPKVESPAPKLPEPIEESYSDSGVSDLPSPKPEKDAVHSSNEFASSPFRRPVPDSSGKGRPGNNPLNRMNTIEAMQGAEDITREFTEGRISQTQYHKLILLRKKMIRFQCLEDLEEGAERKSMEAVERERIKAQKELQRTIERNPKEYALLHPRSKVPPSDSSITAFRPHRDPPKPVAVPHPVAKPKPQERSQVSTTHTYRQQFFVSTRPGTPGGLSGGTPLRTADLRHGGRLSAQNMLNYLLNKPTPKRQPSFQRLSPAPEVRQAINQARKRVIEERSRSVPRLDSLRLQHLQKSRHSHASSHLDFSMDIPSHLNSPRPAKDSHPLKGKKASLRDLLSL